MDRDPVTEMDQEADGEPVPAEAGMIMSVCRMRQETMIIWPETRPEMKMVIPTVLRMEWYGKETMWVWILWSAIIRRMRMRDFPPENIRAEWKMWSKIILRNNVIITIVNERKIMTWKN